MRPLPRFDLEYLALKAIAEGAGEPVGACRLRHRITALGLKVSEASTGRILRELDARSFTEKVRNLGRVITPQGEAHLAELEARLAHLSTDGGDILLDVNTGRRIIEMLQARRGIERETARLAAANAKAEDIGLMGEALVEEERSVSAGGSGYREDLVFHRLIARASGNGILQRALDMALNDVALTRLYEFIMIRKIKRHLNDDHIGIYRAISERNGREAERLMLAHLDGVVFDVEHYLESRL